MVPWGVTANLLLRWKHELKFDSVFPKTGSGEDIDVCLQAGLLQPAAGAVIFHPWRSNMLSMTKRLYEWALGDELLMTKYPQFCFRSLPDFPEMEGIGILLLFVSLVQGPRASILKCVIRLAVIAIADAAGSVVVFEGWNFIDPNSLPVVLCGRQFKSRLILEVTAAFTRNSGELGHFIGKLSRAEVQNLGRRMDFFFGTHRNGVIIELIRATSFQVVCAYLLLLLEFVFVKVSVC